MRTAAKENPKALKMGIIGIKIIFYMLQEIRVWKYERVVRVYLKPRKSEKEWHHNFTVYKWNLN